MRPTLCGRGNRAITIRAPSHLTETRRNGQAADDDYKEKFRPDDAALDQEVDAALAGVSMDDLYGFDKPGPAQPAAAAASQRQQKGIRRGRIVSINKDDVFVDFGGKSQGIVSLAAVPRREPPVVGEEMDFHVDRYDEREGLLILTRKGATAANVTWETLEVGQVVEGTVTGMNKGGLELDVKGMRAFMPAGQVDLYFQRTSRRLHRPEASRRR